MKHRVLTILFIIVVLSFQTSSLPAIDSVQAQITTKPEARGAHSMAFDPHNGVAVIFGGTSYAGGIHGLSDTWIYPCNENSWTELVLTPSPPARSNHAMVYCYEANEIILFGGMTSSDTWSSA